jgi:Fe-S-cluster containining protein
MALLEEDIGRIEAMGYRREQFSMDSKGLVVLKNIRRLCVFHDGSSCTIYKARPVGCRLYPLVYAEYSASSTTDRLCPFREEFLFSSESRRESVKLHHQLIEEARRRKKDRLE